MIDNWKVENVQEAKGSKVHKHQRIFHGGEIFFETQWKYNPIIHMKKKKELLKGEQELLYH